MSSGAAPLKIGLVDDQLLFADALGGYLTEFVGCEVWIAADADGAERIVRERGVRVLLLDYHLPRCKGDECTRRLRAIAPDLRVIVVTHDRSPEVRDACLDAGAEAVVTKDRGLDAVIEALLVAVPR